jgi:mannose-6-phosphate isomerase-like protein (cupin superfamily)
MSHRSLDLGTHTLGLGRDGRGRVLPTGDGPPARIDGLSIGAPYLTREPPHGGEMHPDGDELLLLLSGAALVELEEETGTRRVALAPGQALVVPKGVWHRVRLREPSRLLHVTPGPGGEHRPPDP